MQKLLDTITPPQQLRIRTVHFYFGTVATLVNSEAGAARSAHNDCSNETVHKSKGHFVRGGGFAKARQQPPLAVVAQQQQVVVSTPPNEPSLRYIWLVSIAHPTPIPALHITWALFCAHRR